MVQLEQSYIHREGYEMQKVMGWRWAFFIGGLIVMSLGITMSIKGKIVGTSPWDVLHVGLFQNFVYRLGRGLF